MLQTMVGAGTFAIGWTLTFMPWLVGFNDSYRMFGVVCLVCSLSLMALKERK